MRPDVSLPKVINSGGGGGEEKKRKDARMCAKCAAF